MLIAFAICSGVYAAAGRICNCLTCLQPKHEAAAEANLAYVVGGEANMLQLQHLKGLVDPDNFFVNHQLPGLTPSF